jgi:hypothetical protein
MQITFGWFEEDGEEIVYDNPFEFSEPELLWAALTVGAPSYAIAIRNILDAPAFALHKWFAIRSVTEINGQDIYLSPNYANLDQSEKVVLSYWAGMIFAKLVAEKILHVPWMAHARILQKQGILQVHPPHTKSLPDLIGLDDSGNWHVIEAKGLQKKPSGENERHYRDQAKRIVAIDGKPPESKNYCITYIREHFTINLHDPDTEPEHPVKFEIKPESLQQYYYKPFLTFFNDVKNLIDPLSDEDIIYKKVICDTIDKKKVLIGIVREVLEILNTQKDPVIKEYHFKENMLEKTGFVDKDTYIGPDGIVIKLVPG